MHHSSLDGAALFEFLVVVARWSCYTCPASFVDRFRNGRVLLLDVTVTGIVYLPLGVAHHWPRLLASRCRPLRHLHYLPLGVAATGIVYSAPVVVRCLCLAAIGIADYCLNYSPLDVVDTCLNR